MVENDLRTLFTLEAEANQPPSPISIPAAGRSARIRHRRHRAAAIASPVLAAAAVIGIVASGALLGSGPASGRPGSNPGSANTGQNAPTSLNPLQVYATFGWLPAGGQVENAGTGRAWMFVNGGQAWTLAVYARGQCQLQPITAKAGHSQLSCTGGVLGTGEPVPVAGRAADVRGHRAYWLGAPGPYLAWEYAPGGWAALQYPAPSAGFPLHAVVAKSVLAVKVADHVLVGASTFLRFPAQLTGVPAAWQVSSANSVPASRLMTATLWQFTVGAVTLAPDGADEPTGTPTVSVMPAQPGNPNSKCIQQPMMHTVHRVINGYRVAIQTDAKTHWQGLCAADADGLFVSMYETGAHPAMSLASVFAHLRLLGPDPAHWITRPLG